jgi:VIT1/CCC1 family predicted Fe2+/Mn2+ transporter
MFALGALIPLIPWLITRGTAAVVASVVAASVAAVIVGSALAAFTRRPWWWSAARQLGISAVAAAVTYGIGTAVGVSTGH